ncbi:MAG: FAD-dependent oxidoreductase [Opitutales bacterium]|nr:FAD-dependent oxidoreductase [Opitutales bacterium]
MENEREESCDVAIIGAGLSGLVAARELRKAGLRVQLFEKSRGLGGRMATRRLGEAHFDHGCQFFTVRGDLFREEVAAWEEGNLVAPWFNHLDPQGEASLLPERETLRYRVAGGMTAVAKFLGQGLPVRRQHTISALRRKKGHWELSFAEHGRTFRAPFLLSTAPVPQTLALLDDDEAPGIQPALEPLRQISYAPCFALMLRLDQQPRFSPVGFFAPTDHPEIATLADNAAKGVSSRLGAVSILSTDTFAEANFEEDPDDVTEKLLLASRPWLAGCEVLESSLRRWKFARVVVSHPDRGWLVSPQGLAFAGDAFGGQPRIEGAYLSGLWTAGEIRKIFATR